MIKYWPLLVILPFQLLFGQNQTETYSPIFPETSLPFTLQISTASFTLPTGIQGYARAIRNGKWLLVAGRTNGLHGFNNVGNNFPPSFQNTTIYVVDPSTGESWSRSMTDASSGLSQDEIDDLSVVAPQYYHIENLLYFVGGYGINTGTGLMETKPRLTVIDIDKMISWVMTGAPSAKSAIRQATHPLLQVTGGFLYQDSPHSPFLLMLGQNFVGLYTSNSNGNYTQQILAFWLQDDGTNLSIIPQTSFKTLPDYRRRDLNIVPILHNNKNAYVAFSGVFTLDSGIWTVPITIYPDGSSFEPNPNSSKTFKQGMNNYYCPAFGLYSARTNDMYAVFPGGISYGTMSGGTFVPDNEYPFINQMTTIKIDKHNRFTQYIMNAEFPEILADFGPHIGAPLYFGAEAIFYPIADNILFYNRVIQLDALPSVPTVIGYIAGGIMSSVQNTSTPLTETTASPYVFTVTLIPRGSVVF